MPRLSRNAFVVAFLVVAGVGVLDTLYLTAVRIAGAPISCFLVTGCDEVTRSPYAEILGVPVAFLGLGYYLALAILAALSLETDSDRFLRLALRATPVGILASLYFLAVQAFILKSFCTWCIISAVTSTLLFIIALAWHIEERRGRAAEAAESPQLAAESLQSTARETT